MSDVNDHWWSDFKDLQTEKNLKEKLRAIDPAKVDFSGAYFNSLHDKIMARLEEMDLPGASPRLAGLTRLRPAKNLVKE